MAIQEDDDDDEIEANLFSMLIPEEQESEAAVKPVGDDDTTPSATLDEPSQQLQQHYIRSIESTVVIRQLSSLGLSFQLWPAATAFVNLLDNHRSHPLASPLTPTLSALRSGPRRLRILELGSGTGLVGISAAATLGADVTITDLPHVLPNLQFNADANADVLARNGGAVAVATLGWGDDDQMEDVGREYDLILGSDVVYHDHLYDPLLRTLRFLLINGTEQRAVFLMGHLRRWKKESAFFKKAKKVFDVEVIHADNPLNGSRLGVVVYRFAAKTKREKLTANCA